MGCWFPIKDWSDSHSYCSVPAPTIVVRSTAASPLLNFRPVDTVEIIRLLSCIPAMHCQLNPVTTWLVKHIAVVLAPVLSSMCNMSCDQILINTNMSPTAEKPSLDVVIPRDLLHLSAVLDTVDNEILLKVLYDRFLVNDIWLSWFRSYLTDSTQLISVKWCSVRTKCGRVSHRDLFLDQVKSIFILKM